MNVNAGSDVTVNGRDYRFPKTPTVVRLHRRLRARLYRARDRRRAWRRISRG